MKEKLKQVLKNFFLRMGVNEQEATGYAEDGSLRMFVLFANKLLTKNLDITALSVKEKEYEDLALSGNYAAINEDMKKYINTDSSKLLFDSFMEIVKDVVDDLKTQGAIDDQKVQEIYTNLKTDLTNMVAVNKMAEAPNTQGSLQAIAS